MAFNSKHNRFSGSTFPMGIMKSLMLALGVTLLAACGSSDDFPAGNKSQQPDPLVTDIPLFYIERPLRPGDNGGFEPDNLKDPITFHGNARLIMKIRADQSAPSVNLSARAMPGNVDVRDLDVSPDGNLVVFSLRAPQIEDADEEDQPTWNLWEYDIANDEVRRLISSDVRAENGHDITPRYLADGRVIFASTRQQKSRSILQDEGKDQFSHMIEGGNNPPEALNLHVFDPETQEITQVTFNQSHDFYPVVMNDGKIVFTRWENFGGYDRLSLYEMNPDGTELQLLYGHHTQTDAATSVRFTRSNVLPNGDLFVMVRPDRTNFYGGDFVRIDTNRYIDNTRAVATSSGSGPAQTSITDRVIVTDGTLSPGGYYSAFYPLWDNTGRAVVSWSRCRITLNGTTQPCNDSNVSAPGATIAPAAYGIWTYDYGNDTQIPIIAAQEGIVYTDVVLAAPRTSPSLRYDGDSLTGALEGKVSAGTFSFMTDPENEEAIIHIRNVYDFDGVYDNLGGGLSYASVSNPSLSDAAQRPARFLRVVKTVSEPPRTLKNPANGSFGVAGAQRMKEIIGYAPIEPDGSVKVRVPANVALMLSMVDANGKMLQANGATGGLLRHQNWITLRPGEVMECKGCHTANSTAPHGRYDAQADSLNAGQPPGSAYPGAVGTITSPFANATMAEARVAAAGSDDDDIMELSTDLLFSDVWTDPGVETPDPDISIRYADLPLGLTSPANSSCNDPAATPAPRGWNSRCRIVINYEQHIMPIWELDRGALPTPILASDMEPATCIRCHNPTAMLDDADVNGDPPTQLNLFDTPADAQGIQRSSYRELFAADVPKEVVDGQLVDCTLQVPRVDENGDPVLDGDGNQIIDTETCPANVPAAMSGNGAYASSRFFAVFEGAGSHVGYLTPAELKLIAEWLDIGAQYYNNHFAAPDN